MEKTGDDNSEYHCEDLVIYWHLFDVSWTHNQDMAENIVIIWLDKQH